MKTIITIAREYGSGGHAIGEQLAKELGVPYYDKQLIELAAKETGLNADFVENIEQRKTTSLLYNLYFSAQSLPLSDQVFVAQSNIIKQKAEEGACVITGRCADYVLRNNPHCLHVFIYAPLDDRIARARMQYGANAKDMRAYVLKQDKNRAAYYNHFTTGSWGDAHNYDVSINSKLGETVVMQCIKELVLAKEASR